MRIIKNFLIFLFVILFSNLLRAHPLRPDQGLKNKDTTDSQSIENEVVKWPMPNKLNTSIQLSNSRIDNFQIANNTKGTLVSNSNIAFAVQYFNWLKKDYDFSVGILFESISMMEETNTLSIDNSKVMALGLNSMARFQTFENVYLKGILGLQDKIFYEFNASQTGYEIQKPMIPFLGFGISLLLAEWIHLKIGFDSTLFLYRPTTAGAMSVDTGQGYEIKFFTLWPNGSDQIVSEFFYNSRVQNSQFIRTLEQKIGLGAGYRF